MNDTLDRAKEVLKIEIDGLRQVMEQLDGTFTQLVEACVKTLDGGGKIVVCGVGKSGHIGKKIAATLASTGSPAVFMHPVEASHGDLGLLQKQDLLLTLSYSGETDELLAILPAARRINALVVAMTGYSDSRLGKWCDIVVEMTIPKEACPFNLAPTTTAVAQLALGDALAMVLLEKRGFTKEDYGRFHPGGAIGRAVTYRVSDIMRATDRFALVDASASVKDTLLLMTKSRSGSAVVTDNTGHLIGIFTDGDFRRHVEEDLRVLEKEVATVMTPNPAFVRSEDLAVEVLKLIESKNIDDIIVIDSNDQVVGLVDIQDLPGLKLM